MAVRDDDAAQLVGVLQHVGVVGQDEVDARMVVIGKHEARVVQDHVALALEDGHVLADGVETAERDDLERGVRVLLRRARSRAGGVLLAGAFRWPAAASPSRAAGARAPASRACRSVSASRRRGVALAPAVAPAVVVADCSCDALGALVVLLP